MKRFVGVLDSTGGKIVGSNVLVLQIKNCSAISFFKVKYAITLGFSELHTLVPNPQLLSRLSVLVVPAVIHDLWIDYLEK